MRAIGTYKGSRPLATEPTKRPKHSQKRAIVQYSTVKKGSGWAEKRQEQDGASLNATQRNNGASVALAGRVRVRS